MYKNQLQELAQRSCFNLPSYACIREGPDHGPRFKATVNFNGETFESPTFFSTLRQAEHAAAEIALSTLATRGPSKTLAAKVLDETGVYKNLLQETAHRAGLNLPIYTTVRSGPGHVPVFSCTVELAGMSFPGEAAKTKKQAQKNAAMAAWSSLKQMSQSGSSSSPASSECHEEQDQVIVARFLSGLNPAESSNFAQNNLPKGQHRSYTTSRNSFSPTTSSLSFRYPNWASSNLSPQMAMYYMWMQEQAAEQQRRLMALPVAIPPVPAPTQIFPWMHSMFHPSHHPYSLTEQQSHSLTPGFPIGTPSSSFQFPNKTMVAIQEIQEKKTDESSKLSQADSTLAAVKEDKQESFPSTDNITSAPLEVQENRSLEWTSTEAGLQNPLGILSSRPNKRLSHAPPTVSYHGHTRMASGPHPAHPRPSQRSFQVTTPRMQSGGNSLSARSRPRPGRMQVGGSHDAPFMAPAVQIRSVVPVCSAAPPRRSINSSQERPPSDDTENGTSGGELSIMSSKLGNLHI